MGRACAHTRNSVHSLHTRIALFALLTLTHSAAAALTFTKRGQGHKTHAALGLNVEEHVRNSTNTTTAAAAAATDKPAAKVQENVAKPAETTGALSMKDGDSVIPKVVYTISKSCENDQLRYKDSWPKDFSYKCTTNINAPPSRPDLIPLFNRLVAIQKVDLSRLFLVYENGGGYADSDIEPLPGFAQQFPKFRRSSFIGGYERFDVNNSSNSQIANYVFFAQKHSPVLGSVIDKVVEELSAFYKEKEPSLYMPPNEVLNTTGPHAFTRAVNSVLNVPDCRSKGELTSIFKTKLDSQGRKVAASQHHRNVGVLEQEQALGEDFEETLRDGNAAVLLARKSFGCRGMDDVAPVGLINCDPNDRRIW
eukprot:CAMPEP_0197524632 /NCGR_PEP_ID=MMETSP1318-20131121/9246_1 /TAXON_ID=552666 /ORGANISM="Partenskyella glossopodia, Strain RCC365" /LENGTH=364 /DNA_ID=CAMNT_0043077621 /DNA_START=178 /DNA_END=1269 /DNA_ORIENTATION=+